MGVSRGWTGAKMWVAAGVLVTCAGCVINAPAASPSKAAAPQGSSQVPTPSVLVTTPARRSPAGPTPARRALTGPGTYTFTYQGAVGTIQVPANIKDPRLEPYGDYRRLAGARPITYLIAQVDNQSDDTINMYEVIVVTAEGQQIEATSISNYVDTWRDAFAAEGGDAKKYNQGIELSNSSNFYLLPGAKGTAFLGAEEPIKSVERVFVYPAGAFDRVEAKRTK